MCTMDRGNFDNISCPISFEVVKNSFTTKLFFEIVKVTAKHEKRAGITRTKKENKKAMLRYFMFLSDAKH